MFDNLEDKINKYVKVFVMIYGLGCILVAFISLLITLDGNYILGLPILFYTILSGCLVWMFGALSLLFVKLVEENKRQTKLLQDIQQKIDERL